MSYARNNEENNVDIGGGEYFSLPEGNSPVEVHDCLTKLNNKYSTPFSLYTENTLSAKTSRLPIRMNRVPPGTTVAPRKQKPCVGV